MKKKYFNFLMVCASFLALTFFVSCSEDEPTMVGDDDDDDPVVTVDDGMYLVGSATSETASSAFIMGPGFVGNQDGISERSNMFATFAYMTSGTFQFIEYDDGDSTIYGGTLTATPLPDNAEANYYTGTLTADGGAITVPTENALHHVVVDKTSNTIVITPIEFWEVIGTATEGGWSTGTQIPFKEVTSEGATVFEATGIELGTYNADLSYKFRYNSNWDIAFDDIDDFNVFTNLGFTDDAFVVGGANLALDEAGVYTITASFSNGAAAFTLEKTGDANAVTFDPADFPWGIIGEATATGWDADTDLQYLDWANTWTGMYYLTASVFKFRNDDAWSAEVNPGNVNLTSTTVTDNGDNNFVTETEGLYFVRISAVEGEEGTTWNLEIDIVNPGLIGEAIDGWDNPDVDIPAVTTSGTDLSWKIEQYAFNAGGWKIRIGDGWEFGYGFPDVTINGTNAALLTDADGNFNLAAAGSHDVTFSTSDNGATWTVTFD